MKRRGWTEESDHVYKTKEIEEENIEEEELDHIEYADDTTLINPGEETEEQKLKSYKNSAEKYDLEIQWGKTLLLRKRIPSEKEGEAAELEAPFHEVKQKKRQNPWPRNSDKWLTRRNGKSKDQKSTRSMDNGKKNVQKHKNREKSKNAIIQWHNKTHITIWNDDPRNNKSQHKKNATKVLAIS